eukprot:superscaffoldBa00007767_g22808
MAAESTRRFTKNLLKPGSAAEIRQTACNAVRHSAVAGKVGQDKSGSGATIKLIIGSDVNGLIILESQAMKRGKPERNSGRK